MKYLVVALCLFLTACSSEPSAPVGSVQGRSRSIGKNFSRLLSTDTSLLSIDTLLPLFPNPFNSFDGDTTVHIRFALKDTSRAVILIQNPIGDEVVRFTDSLLPKGYYEGNWKPVASDGTALPNGLYFITLHAEHVLSGHALDSLNAVVRSRLLNFQG